MSMRQTNDSHLALTWVTLVCDKIDSHFLFCKIGVLKNKSSKNYNCIRYADIDLGDHLSDVVDIDISAYSTFIQV